MSINELYNMAEIAQAAYSSLSGQTDSDSNEGALREDSGANFTQAQAEEFAASLPRHCHPI